MELVNDKDLICDILKKRNAKGMFADSLLESSFVKDFSYRFCWSSNAIEGNTLSLDETISVIEYDEVRSGHTFSEYQEAKDLFKAINNYMIPLNKREITKEWIQKVNEQIMSNEVSGYRKKDVYIGNVMEATYYPPSYQRVPELMREFLQDINECKTDAREMFDMIAEKHILFERIHPFENGNGRTGRVILNQQLVNHGFLPIVIPPKSDYSQAFRRYDKTGDISKMRHIICKSELASINRLEDMSDVMKSQTQKKTVRFEPYYRKENQRNRGLDI